MTDQTIKQDAGKPQLHLVPPQINFDIAEAREYGVKKYGSVDSWRQVEFTRYLDAYLRHTMAMMADPLDIDAESGIAHYKLAACNLAFISEMIAKGKMDLK